MVHRAPAIFIRIEFEHREVDDPQRCPLALYELQVVTDFQAQRTHRVIDDLGRIGAKEYEVVILRAGALEDASDGRIGEELDDRGLQPVTPLGALVDLDIGQTLGSVTRHEGGVVVDFLAGEFACTRHTHRSYATIRILGGACEYFEVAIGHEIRHIDELERDTQIRLVARIATHGFGVGHAREWIRQLDLRHLGEDVANEPFHQIHDLILREERGLDIELREVRLTIGAQIFVAEATHDLIVAIESRNHQQLLENLR